MSELRPRSPQGSGSRRKGVSSPQGTSLKPTPAFRHHTLVAMEMGEHGLGALVTPPEAASASLDCTQFKKAWRGETALRWPCLPIASSLPPTHLQAFPGQPKVRSPQDGGPDTACRLMC